MVFADKRPVVLVVEDELLLRINAVEMISEAGFDVVEVGNSDEAISILEDRPDIHIVFTDIHMPGSMDGLKLARFVRDRWLPIKLIKKSLFSRVSPTPSRTPLILRQKRQRKRLSQNRSSLTKNSWRSLPH